MTTKIYRVLDTDEEPWHICPGDPAHGLLDRLDKLNWEGRLPASVLRSGQVTEEEIAQADGHLQMFLDHGLNVDDVAVLDKPLLAAHRTLRQLRYLKEDVA